MLLLHKSLHIADIIKSVLFILYLKFWSAGWMNGHSVTTQGNKDIKIHSIKYILLNVNNASKTKLLFDCSLYQTYCIPPQTIPHHKSFISVLVISTTYTRTVASIQDALIGSVYDNVECDVKISVGGQKLM